MSLRDFLFIIFYVKFDKVKLINSYFRFADKSKIEELKKKVLFSERQNVIFDLYYVQENQDLPVLSEVQYEIKDVTPKKGILNLFVYNSYFF